ncbi:MAG: hypothetical protein NZM12_13005 [Steroidobacteraceae bacterium]|nr:hypothetical protein [Steroidobacteraceae bacterium]MDW8260367.1 proton-conducting transporter membrane subunit [Gammaproteobacteria bacterium]
MTATTAMTLALLTPVVGACVIGLLDRLPNAREAATLMTASALFICVWQLLDPVLAGARPAWTALEMMPGLPLAWRVEPLGLLFALVASALWIVNSAYSIGYLRANAERHQTRFYVCFALALAATIGIAFAANLLTLFLCYELLTLVTYPLVTHAGSPEARRAGRLYLGMLVGSSVLLMLPAIVYVWYNAGTTEFRAGGILASDTSATAVTAALACFVFGIGKAALMPVHRWLPAAMVAPTPVSALLHAVAVVKAGVFCIVKIAVGVFGIDRLAGQTTWLALVAGFTALSAAVVALRADNLKRRLAYSTVSQLAYIVLAVSLTNVLSVIGAALHIATHAVGKITLFFAAGSIYTAAHKTAVSELAGIGRQMPWTMAAFAIAALSLVGVPPLAGFVSKWSMLAGAAHAPDYAALAVFGLGTLLSAAYLLPIVYTAFFDSAPATAARQCHGEAPWPMLLATLAGAGGCLALIVCAEPLLRLARALADSAF